MRLSTLLLLLLLASGTHAGDVREHPLYKTWLLALQDGPEEKRKAAASELRDSELDVTPMLSALRLGLLKAETEPTASFIAEVLITLGPDAREALPDVIAALQLGILGLEKAATIADALGEPAHPDIIACFFRPPQPLFLLNFERNDAPFGVLIEIARRAPNKVLPVVLDQLKRDDIDMEDILIVLQEVLAHEAREQTPGDRQEPDERIPWLLPTTRAALIRALRPLLRTDDPILHLEVLELLLAVQPTLLDELFPEYFALQQLDSVTANADVERLVAFYAFRPLLAMLAHGPQMSREQAYRFLESLTQETDETSFESVRLGRRLLVQGLGHPAPKVRWSLVAILGNSPQFEPVVEQAFRRLLNDPDRSVRMAAAHRLLNVNGGDVELRRNFMESAAAPASDLIERIGAIEALGQMREQARPAVPLLLRLCKSPNVKVRHAAAQALTHIDPTTSPTTLPILKDCLACRNGGT